MQKVPLVGAVLEERRLQTFECDHDRHYVGIDIVVLTGGQQEIGGSEIGAEKSK